MLRVFSSRRRGVQPLEASEELLKEKQHEQCKDIRAMLVLLKNITDRELAAEDNHLDIAKVSSHCALGWTASLPDCAL